MSQLIQFQFKDQQVRFVGTADIPSWVAKDVAQILQISNLSQALSRLDEDEKGYIILNDPLGNEKKYRTINESGLYSLILSSRKEVAKTFKKWVTSEVLPAIRKTGSYSISSFKSQLPQQAIEVAAKCLENAGIDVNQTQLWKLDQYAKYSQGQDQLIFQEAKKLIASNSQVSSLPLSPTEIGQLLGERLKMEAISPRQINRMLIELGFQTSIQKTSKTSGKKKIIYDLTELGEKYGHRELTTARNSDGKIVTQIRWLESIVDVLVPKSCVERP